MSSYNFRLRPIISIIVISDDESDDEASLSPSVLSPSSSLPPSPSEPASVPPSVPNLPSHRCMVCLVPINQGWFQLRPCGHGLFCGSCSERIIVNFDDNLNTHCPFCRMLILDRLQIFLVS